MKRITSAALALLLLLSLLLSALPAALAQEPEAVQNAALWVRADAGVSTDADGKLTQWADQSGNGHNGTPLNGAKTPVLVQNSIGGKPALQFTGGNQIIDFGQPLPESWDRSAYSVFFVYRPRIVPNGGYHFIGADNWTMFNLHTNNSGGLYAGFCGDSVGKDPEKSRITDSETVSAYQAGELAVMQFTYQDGKVALYKNGALLKEKNVTAQPVRWDKFRLGIENAKVGLDGELAELIVYDRKLEQTEQTAVTRYLRAKYDENVSFVTGVSLSQTEASLKLGEKLTLTAAVSPETAENKQLLWSSSAPQIATVTDGLVSAVGAGTAVITAASAEDQTISASCTVQVTGEETAQTLLKSAWVWLDASHVEKDASGVLTRWPDQTANQNDGVAHTGTAMPVLVPNAAGTLPAVRFETENKTKDAMDIPTMQGSMDNFSLFFVYKPKTFDGDNNHVIGAKNSWGQFVMHTLKKNTGDGSLYAGVTINGRFDETNAGKAYYREGVWNLLEFCADGKALSLYRNGKLLGTSTAASASGSWAGFELGVADQMQGDMAELLVFNRALTEEQRRSVSDYLLERYADILPPELTIHSSNGLRLTRENPTTQLTVSADPASSAGSITWSVTGTDGEATELAEISPTGLLTARKSGTVIATATHSLGSTASVTLTLDMADVLSVAGDTQISEPNGTTKLTALRNGEPEPDVTWYVYDESMAPTDLAQIAQDGTLTALKNGTVLAIAQNAAGERWAAVITISGQSETGADASAVYVSMTGSDADPGTFQQPKRTLAAALATGASRVWVMPGTYDQTQTLRPASGTTISGFPMGTALVTGGMPVPVGAQWERVEGQPYYAVSVAVPNGFRELYVDGKTAKLAESGSMTGSWYQENGKKRGYIVTGVDLSATTDSDLEMHWDHRYWRCNRLVVDEVRRDGTKTILLPEQNSFEWATVVDFEAAGPLATNSFTLLNDLSFLDEPGEWFYDRTAQKLYYYPQPGEDVNEAEFYIPQIDTIFELSGTSPEQKLHDVTIENLELAYTTWQRTLQYGSSAVQADFVSNGSGNGSHTDAGELPGALIHSEFADAITITDCSFHSTGANAVILENAVSNSTVQNSTFQNISFSAITISRPQNSFLDQENEEVPKDILIFNNRIDNVGAKYHSGSSICGYYTDGLTVDHNYVSHTAWSGMTFGWNGWQATEKDSVTHRNLTITHNHIYSFAEVSRDSGGIYTLGQCPNAIIAYNYLDKIVRDYGGIYNDEGTGYYMLYRNVIDRIECVNPYPITWGGASTHDNYALENYHSAGTTRNLGTNCFIDKQTKYTPGNRPEAAQKIVDEAGLTTQPYTPLRSAAEGDVAYGKNATFVCPDGTQDLGAPGHMPQFALNGWDVTYAQPKQAGSRLVVDLLGYYDLTAASLRFADSQTAAYAVQTSADGIDWADWDAASAVSHVRFVRFVPAQDVSLCILEAEVFGTLETEFTAAAPLALDLPQKEAASVILSAEQAQMTNRHLSVWANTGSGEDAVIPPSHAKNQDPQAAANSGYSKKPIVLPGTVQGRPLVRFDGFDDAMQITSVSGSASDMTFALYARPTDAGHFKFSTDGFTLQISGGKYQIALKDGASLTADVPVVMNTWQRLVLTVSEGKLVLLVDGTAVISGAAAGGAEHHTLRLGDNVGIRYKNYGTALGADLAELILYTQSLSEEDGRKLDGAMQSKYSAQQPVVTPVTGVTLDRSTLELTEGESAALTASVAPAEADDKRVTWTSSDETVAKVDSSGRVTAMKAGTATITVTTVDGGFTAECTVTVKAKQPAVTSVTGVTLDKGTLELTEGEAASLTAVVTPAEADDKRVTWTSSDETVAKVDGSGRVTAVKAGTVTITVTTIDGSFTAACTVTVKARQPEPDPILPILPSLPGQTRTFPFRDVAKTAWYYREVKGAWEKNLIDGVTLYEFRPDAALTVAQAIKLSAALHQMNETGKVTLKNGAGAWYSTYAAYAVDNGIIEASYLDYTDAQMNAAVSRAEFVHIFYGAMRDYAEMNTVADHAIPDVKTTDRFADEIYTFYRAGILTGSDAKGTFHAESNIKRSEVAAILYRMFEPSARKTIKLP